MGRGMNPDDETALSEEARAEIEAKEDDFVGQVEEAQSVMKNVSLCPASSSMTTYTRAGPRHPRTPSQSG